MKAFYNDNDPFAVKWLENLIAEELITGGKVDGRGIEKIQGADLEGFERVHLFAGIGGWDYALQLAEWEGPVWTMSCPCQPYSCAGRGRGAEDPRHLWPQGRRLIAESRPPTIFGEQVASPAGREWLSGVRADLEDLGYSVGAADLCAASVQAPHGRARLWWVANSSYANRRPGERRAKAGTGSYEERGRGPSSGGADGGVADRHGAGRIRSRRTVRKNANPSRRTDTCNGSANVPWASSIPISCEDGKARRVALEPSLFPLAHGLPGRVGLLRGAGNSIVPQVAAEFVIACKEAISRRHE